MYPISSKISEAAAAAAAAGPAQVANTHDASSRYAPRSPSRFEAFQEKDRLDESESSILDGDQARRRDESSQSDVACAVWAAWHMRDIGRDQQMPLTNLKSKLASAPAGIWTGNGGQDIQQAPNRARSATASGYGDASSPSRLDSMGVDSMQAFAGLSGSLPCSSAACLAMLAALIEPRIYSACICCRGGSRISRAGTRRSVIPRDLAVASSHTFAPIFCRIHCLQNRQVRSAPARVFLAPCLPYLPSLTPVLPYVWAYIRWHLMP